MGIQNISYGVLWIRRSDITDRRRGVFWHLLKHFLECRLKRLKTAFSTGRYPLCRLHTHSFARDCTMLPPRSNWFFRATTRKQPHSHTTQVRVSFSGRRSNNNNNYRINLENHDRSRRRNKLVDFPRSNHVRVEKEIIAVCTQHHQW